MGFFCFLWAFDEGEDEGGGEEEGEKKKRNTNLGKSLHTPAAAVAAAIELSGKGRKEEIKE